MGDHTGDHEVRADGRTRSAPIPPAAPTSIPSGARPPDPPPAAPRPARGADVDQAPPVTTLSSRQMGRALGALYTVGSLLAAVWVALPHSAQANDRVVVGMIAVALVFGLSMLLGLADDLPGGRFHPIIAV